MIKRQSNGLLKGPSQNLALNLVVLRFTQTCLSTQLKMNMLPILRRTKLKTLAVQRPSILRWIPLVEKTGLSCELNIVKGFTALYEGDSALQVLFTFESISLMSFFSNFNVFLFKL